MADEKTPVMKAMKDTISFELTKPVLTRMRKRLAEIQLLSRARFEKEMKGNVAVWHNTEPEMFISGLDAKIQNGVGYITYHRYAKDEKGNRKLTIQQSKSPITGYTIDVSAEYNPECLVVETIEYHKPLKIEEKRFD